MTLLHLLAIYFDVAAISVLVLGELCERAAQRAGH